MRNAGISFRHSKSSSRLRLFALLCCTVFINCAGVSADRKPKRIFIDPGHTKVTNSVSGIVGEEYIVNYRVCRYLKEMLDADKRFTADLNRDETDYIPGIKAFHRSNNTFLRGVVATVVPGEHRNTAMTAEQNAELYAVRHYAISNRYDLLVSVHFDYLLERYRSRQASTKGFHVTASPFNRRFDESLGAASNIAKALGVRYKPNRAIDHDTPFITPEHKKNYPLAAFLADGVVIRSLIILGDAFENSYVKKNRMTAVDDVPSVLIECGFLHEKQFCDDAELKELARMIYNGIVLFGAE
ncbi:MAG: N-acetylmuramoyl-L-alanine amidase [Spirochaetes bacterium]|nr:N-acetylmuramoyl-L-alanine amidase [Spirochaetota bacterium]